MISRTVVLTGGVGGAKLVDGLVRVLEPGSVTAVVNTGDDFRHFGLPISPDVDTLLYTLAGKASRAQGWGRDDETWTFMESMRSLGGEDWFRLGDGDLALHILRMNQLAAGQSLSQFIAGVVGSWAISAEILPMSDDPVMTMLETDEGQLEFQRYFVERQCRPVVGAIEFAGAVTARAAPGVLERIESATAIFIAPSNPWLSVDPILAIEGIATALRRSGAPVVAVSPLVAGKAVKGPTTKLMGELGIEIGNAAIAEHYSPFLDAMLVHNGDAAIVGLPCAHTDTLMFEAADRDRVALAALALARALS